MCLWGKKTSELTKRNQLSCKRMFLTERVVPICYMDPLPFIQEYNGIYNQFLVESRCIGINLHDPLSTAYTDLLFFSLLFCKDIPNVPAVRKETIFLNLANLRTKPNENMIFLIYTAQSSAVWIWVVLAYRTKWSGQKFTTSLWPI